MFKTKFYDRKDITYYIEDSIDYKKWNSLSTVEKDAFSYEFYDELDLNRVNAQNGGNGKLYTKADKPLAPPKFKIRVKNLNPWLRKIVRKVGKVAIKKTSKKIPIIGTGITIYAVYEGYQEDGMRGAVINFVF